MSQEERDWLDWLKRAKAGSVTQKLVAEKMGVTDRWVRKLLRQMETRGDAVVVHGLRGRASNRRIAEELKARAMEMVKSPEWHDFGPTFASQQLAKRHQIEVSKETPAAMDDRGEDLGEPVAQGQGSSSVAAKAEPLWRTGAVGHLRS
jgi:hypothetical protein